MTTFIVSLPSQQLLRGRDDEVRAETEFWQEVLQWRGGAEGMHADHLALRTDVAIPAERGAHFDGNARCDGGGQNAFFVGGVLLIENFPAGHADDARLDAFGFEFFVGGDTVLEFGAGAQEDDFGLAAIGVGENVTAFGYAGSRSVFSAVERGYGLAAEDERGRPMRVLHGDLVGFGDFVGVTGTKDEHIGHRAESSELLDWLVGRAVFADADGIVREDEERWNFHESGETHAGAHVVAEIEKGGGEAAQAGEGEAVDGGAHAMFANAEVDVAALVFVGEEITGAFEDEIGLVGLGEVG